MKNQALFALSLVIGISIGMSQWIRADVISAATDTSSHDGQGDFAGDVMKLFAVNYDGMADVYSFCTEGSQQGNWQDNPLTLKDTPHDGYINEPGPVFASYVPSGNTPGRPYYPHYPRTPDPPPREGPPDPPDPPDPPPVVPSVPEPATMLMLGLGIAGLLPFSYRKRK